MCYSLVCLNRNKNLYLFVLLYEDTGYLKGLLSSFFSNPDLRRSELSLDAMLQRTSSNSSSSSSPSSQGGSAERRGIKPQALKHIIQAHKTHTKPNLANINIKWMLVSKPEKNQCVGRGSHILCMRTSTYIDMDFESISRTLQFCTDQPVWCALLLWASGEVEERKWEREIERSAERGVKQQARGISKICMDFPLTNT